MKDAGLIRAIDAAGSTSALARLCGIKQQSVQQWRRVPADRVVAVHDVTGIPLHELRPDLYRQVVIAEPAQAAA